MIGIQKKSLLVTCAVIIAVMALAMIEMPQNARANPGELHVGGGGAGNYTTIQDAIDDAIAGDTIIVWDGTYTENVDVSKTLTILSKNGSANCIVQAATAGDHVIDIAANWVNVSGLTVQGATGSEKAGIHLYNRQHCNISKNNATGNYFGIAVERGVDTRVRDNIMMENTDLDFYLYAHEIAHCNNIIVNNTGSGGYPIMYYNSTAVIQNAVYAELFLANADFSTIDNVTIIGSATENNNGIILHHTDNTSVTNCTSSNNKWGICLYRRCNNNTVANNTCIANTQGIFVDFYSNNNTVENNTVNCSVSYGINVYFVSKYNIIQNNSATGCGQFGIRLQDSADHCVIHNNNASNNQNRIHLWACEFNNITYIYLYCFICGIKCTYCA